MKRLVIYVHGKGGSAEEAKHYQPLFPASDVIGFDYHAQLPGKQKTNFLVSLICTARDTILSF